MVWLIARWLVLLGWALQGFCAPRETLGLGDVPHVLDRLFSFHIENKQLSATLVRRSMKIYIEQFDAEKVYLLAQEVAPFLQLSEAEALRIVQRLNNRDYSDFLALHRVFQTAIHRAEAMRSLLVQEMLEAGTWGGEGSSSSRYANSELELKERQKVRMVRFFSFHQSRSVLDSAERKAKVFSLFERKISRFEANFLWKDELGAPLPLARSEHLLTVKMLKAFARSLDTHTSFFSPEEAYEMRLSLEKQFEGVGVILSESVDGIVIAELIKGSPAELSGKIRMNDILVEIDGRSVQGMAFEDVLDVLKKKARGEIILGVQREGALFHVSLQKQPIVMNEERMETSTEKFGDGIIGKVALHSFYESGSGVSSEKDLKEAIRSFQQQGPLHGLILDLRENAGGFLSQAVKVAGLFLSNGVVVISKYGKDEIHYLRTLSGRPFFNGPVVILTSKMSASAAEIVAQALQDYGVAVVVGDERTFGKGSIQFQNVTDEKADIFFKVTVGRYYTASGRSTQIDGVVADIVVPTQYAPYNIGERFLEYPLSRDSVAPAYTDPLTDLDEKTKTVFQKRYLPFTQRIVSVWKKALPQLKKNSAQRLNRDADFQAFTRKLDKVRARQHTLPVNTIDEHIRIGMEDLQMKEAVNVVKDMLLIEAEAREASATGTGSP